MKTCTILATRSMVILTFNDALGSSRRKQEPSGYSVGHWRTKSASWVWRFLVLQSEWMWSCWRITCGAVSSKNLKRKLLNKMPKLKKKPLLRWVSSIAKMWGRGRKDVHEFLFHLLTPSCKRTQLGDRHVGQLRRPTNYRFLGHLQNVDLRLGAAYVIDIPIKCAPSSLSPSNDQSRKCGVFKAPRLNHKSICRPDFCIVVFGTPFWSVKYYIKA